jgi:two-component system, OmpR family, sensor kinase
VYDSAASLGSAVAFTGTINAYSIPAELQRGEYGQVNALGGSFIEGGTEWLYIALDSLQMRADSYYVAFAAERPRQTLQDALADFGTEVFPLLTQAALASLVIAVALATLISRSIARPMQNMAQAAGQIADGHLDRRVPIEGTIEMQDMGASFNRMVDQLRDEQRSQQDFLANVSHDLKTPLTSIQGYSQAIVDGAAPDPVRAARIIYDEAARLNRMVVELTDLARLQAGRMSMQLTALDIGQLAAAVGQRLTIMAQEKHITLTLETPSLPPISGDGDRMDQVLTNLISNAIKYTPEGGTVSVKAAQANGGVMVEVRDTGIGIEPEQLPRIFERFYQVDKARGPRRGTGLGLAIVQEIVTAHGGTISVASEGRGRGSTFTLWLPSPQVSTVMRRR